jgi:hypothetical protein
MQMLEVMAGQCLVGHPKIVDEETLRVLAALATISAHPTGPRLHVYATFEARSVNICLSNCDSCGSLAPKVRHWAFDWQF